MRPQELIRNCLRLEAAIGLLSRSRPVNLAQETRKLLVEWQAGSKRNPKWSYAKSDDLWDIQAALRQLRVERQRAAWSDLWEARCDELELDLALVEAIGQPSLRRLSEQRFNDAAWAKTALELSNAWVLHQPLKEAAKEPTDSPHTTSLLNNMRAAVEAERLPFRVVVSDALFSAAATGDGVIWVAAGSSVFTEEVPRIVVHEVFGHAWPRARAAKETCELFAVGTARGNDTQEGYAVWYEVTSRTQTARRRQELGLRHLAACSVWQGADWVQTVELLLARGATLSLAHTIASRAHRGGGLAREAVYLQAYCRMRDALALDAGLLQWLGAGRLNLDAIQLMRAHGYRLSSTQPAEVHAENSAITGM